MPFVVFECLQTSNNNFMDEVMEGVVERMKEELKRIGTERCLRGIGEEVEGCERLQEKTSVRNVSD